MKTAGDTLIISPAAFSLESDAMLEDFLKLIPGLEFDGKTLTLYGRKINKLLLNGRLYFGGDIVSGLKNISADSIESIRTYERQSDFSRLSGIDDGEEEPVLDVKIKRSFMEAWRGHAKMAGGLPSNYRGSLNLSKISDTVQTTIAAGAQNVAGLGYLSKTDLNRSGAGSRGDAHTRDAGFEYAFKNKKLEYDASVRYNATNAQKDIDSYSRTVYANGITYYHSLEDQLFRKRETSAQGTVEWRPNKYLTLYAKPTFSYTGNDNWRNPLTGTFNTPDTDGSPLNTNERHYATLTDRVRGNVVLQLTRRSQSKKGRSVSIRLSAGGSAGDNLNFNEYFVQYKSSSSAKQQYVTSPWKDSDVSAQVSLNEPLRKHFFLQLIINARSITHGMDRDFYSMTPIAGDWSPSRTLSKSILVAGLPEGYISTLDPALTSSGFYRSNILTVTTNIRYVKKKFNITAGATIKPTWSKTSYSTMDTSDGKTDNYVCYAAPFLTLRYNKSKQNFMSLTYRSSINTPRPANLIPVRTGTNPNSVRIGNPDLKPSFSHRINIKYDFSKPTAGESLVGEVSAQIMDNAFTSSTEYVPETGGRIYRSCNISGNWSANGNLTFNKTFKGTPWDIANTLSGAFFNENSYLYNSTIKKDEVNTMHRTSLSDRFTLTGRWPRFNITLKAGADYFKGRSLLRSEFQEEPHACMAGTEIVIKLPRSFRCTMSADYISKGNYTYESLNRDYVLMNATVSKSFLKGKATLRAEATDLLGQDINMVHGFSGMTISASEYNGTTRYLLLHFIYRFTGK